MFTGLRETWQCSNSRWQYVDYKETNAAHQLPIRLIQLFQLRSYNTLAKQLFHDHFLSQTLPVKFKTQLQASPFQHQQAQAQAVHTSFETGAAQVSSILGHKDHIPTLDLWINSSWPVDIGANTSSEQCTCIATELGNLAQWTPSDSKTALG